MTISTARFTPSLLDGPTLEKLFTAREKTLADAGDASEAIKQLAVVLEDASRVLGPDHPNTLASRNNLARLIGQMGDPVRAAEEFQALLPDMLRVFGPDHLYTLEVERMLDVIRQLDPVLCRPIGSAGPQVA